MSSRLPLSSTCLKSWAAFRAQIQHHDVDALFPAIFGCYAAELDRRKLLPLNIDPAIAAFRRDGAGAALLSLEDHVRPDTFLCSATPTVADIFCLGDVTFAE